MKHSSKKNLSMNHHLTDLLSEVEDFHWWFEGRRALLTKVFKKYLKRNKDIKILDVGCGTGGNMKFLSTFGRVYGVDNLKVAVDFSKKRGFKDSKVADAYNLPFKDESFELVTFLDVLEHIKDDKKALEEAKRVLKPGGLIVITVPALPLIYSEFDKMQGHQKRYLYQDLAILAKRLDLTKLYMNYFNFFFSIPIASIRIASRFKIFNRLGRYDSRINYDISKVGIFNDLLLGIFKIEIALSNLLKYPFGISLIGVFRKEI